MLGWLLAVVLAVLLARRRRELARLRAELAAQVALAQPAPREEVSADGALGVPVSEALAVLRLELARLAAAGELARDELQRLSARVDAHWQATLARSGVEPGSPAWERARSRAWLALAAHGLVPYAPRPWERPATPGRSGLAPGESTSTRAAYPEGVSVTTFALGPAGPASDAAGRKPDPPGTRSGLGGGGPTRPARPLPARGQARGGATAPAARGAVAAVSPGADPVSVLQPAEPSPLERALRALSGWPRALLPFLVQNVGWFIGGFLFLAGSVFLVSYTAGFARTLAVFAALFAYTGALVWGGYQIRRRRPALAAASDTLLTLGMLLAPLVLAAAARLLLAGSASWLHGAVGLGASLVTLGAFLFAAEVISGVTDRALQGTHPRLYVALAAVQLALPLLAASRGWPLLMALHALLLGLLAYGLRRYARDWMRSIFVDRRKVAYFAAGTLVYAATVSFVHLTWGASPTALPPGYYGPFLMAVCGLLFYLDGAFKAWADGHAFLSRFSFLVYGLSALAVLLSIEGPVARLLTLALGAGLYAAVAWHYLTRVPAYLLIASLAALYGLTVLVRVPGEAHFIAALPALAALLALSRWLQALAARRAAALPLARTAYRLLFGVAWALAAWSLAQGRPGPLALATAALLAALAWHLLAAAPGPLIGRAERPGDAGARIDLRDGPWLYSVVVAVTAGAAWAPPWTGLGPGLQLALSLALLAWPWTWLAGRPGTPLPRVEVYANGALASVAAGLGLAAVLAPGGPGRSGFLAAACGIGAIPLLGLSLRLHVPALFYAFLGVAGAGAVLARLAFLPGPSSGAALLLGGLGLWALLWWTERQPAAVEALRRHRVPRPLTLLGLFAVTAEPPAGPPDDESPEPAPGGLVPESIRVA